jgi:5-(carboxyamino)imidazole ribonucleotide mutase
MQVSLFTVMLDVHIIIGSKNDMPIAEKTIKILDEFDIGYEVIIASAHRTPERVKRIVERSDAKVFIAIAGLAAALPGAVAAYTTKPVIGVPVSGKVNLDSILSIVQMPRGIPIAAVGLDNGENAALLAAEILALNSDDINKKIQSYRERMRKKIEGN